MTQDQLSAIAIDSLAKLCQSQRVEIAELKSTIEQCRKDYHELSTLVTTAHEKISHEASVIYQRERRVMG